MKQTILLLSVIGLMPLSAQTYHNDTTVSGVQTLQVDGDLSVKPYGTGLGGNLEVIGGTHIAKGGVSLPGMPTGVTGTYYGTFKLGEYTNIGEFVFEKEGNNTTGGFIVPLGRVGDWLGSTVQLDIMVGTHDYDSGAAHFTIMSRKYAPFSDLNIVSHTAFGGGVGIKLHGKNANASMFVEYAPSFVHDAERQHKIWIRMTTLGAIHPEDRTFSFSDMSPIRIVSSLSSVNSTYGNEMTESLNAENIHLNGAVSIASGVGASPNIVLNGGSGRISLSGAGSGIYSGANPILTLDGTGGVSFAGGSTLNVTNTTASSSSTTGALTVTGGLGVGMDAYINGVRVGRGGGNMERNTALGNSSLFENTSGNNNTSVGFESLFGNISGSDNIAVGVGAMKNNITGARNTVLGSYASYYNDYGGGNVSIGALAMGYAQYIYDSTVIGAYAGQYLYGCGSNVIIGNNAGCVIEDGYTNLYDTANSVYIGSNVRGGNFHYNSIAIGADSVSEGANTTVIGNSSTIRSKIFGSLETPNNLKVEGDSLLKGNTTLEGNVTISVPQGDISMGIYQ